MAPTLIKSFVVFAFIALVSAQDDKCTTVTKGALTGTPVMFPRYSLPKLQPSWFIPITQPCKVAGVMMNVCDPDGAPAPSVEILNLSKAWITRNADSMLHDITVDVIVFCKATSPYNPYGERV
ncbi:hypothetical protein evm_012438 [Chilo suppressalis]|nr:hypothetical protein evm_012438 [Chilo suppressalis]